MYKRQALDTLIYDCRCSPQEARDSLGAFGFSGEDALKAVGIPTVEVHISDVSAREDFRQRSFVRATCIATVMGKGFDGYCEAMDILLKGAQAE